MNKIYLLLSRTNTLPSRAIHSILGGRFTHVSIALRPTTNEFYSFARKDLNNPLNAGFIIENVHTHVFGKYPDCLCSVYALDVSDEAYEKASKIIARFVDKKDEFNYNFLGLLPAKLGFKLHRKYHFTCSQFVASVLAASHAVDLPKDASLMMPNDFLKLRGIKELYSGRIADCKISLEPNINVYRKKKLLKNI